jgi:Fe-S-cluster containining protein
LNSFVPTDCQRCGVCCFSPTEEYVWVTGYDWSRLGTEAERLAHFIGNRAFMKMKAGHCAALEVRRSAAGQTSFACGIYDQRPEICRVLERGSPECLADLETKAEQVADETTRESGVLQP